MSLRLVNILPVFPAKIFVEWDYSPDPADAGAVTFNVERSGSPGGPWTDISGDITNGITFEDNFTSAGDGEDEKANLLSLSRQLYYRVKATTPSGIVTYSSVFDNNGIVAPTYNSPKETIGYTVDSGYENRLDKRFRLLRNKLLRDEYIRFKKLVGLDLYVIKQRHFGESCDCVDPLTEMIIRDNCDQCFGTGWIGGYYTPIATVGHLRESSVNENTTQHGPSTVNNTLITLLSYPQVSKGDVIVEKDTNRRWTIQNVSATELKRHLVHQRAQVSELARSSPIYDVSIPGIN